MLLRIYMLFTTSVPEPRFQEAETAYSLAQEGAAWLHFESRGDAVNDAELSG